jgi:hypothetical protein
MIYKNMMTTRLKGSEKIDNWKSDNTIIVLVMEILMSGMSRITHKKDHREGMIKNPPIAMEVRI